MADNFMVGESLVGDGNEVAHIDLIIGSKSGPAGVAFVQRARRADRRLTTASSRCWPRTCWPSRTR